METLNLAGSGLLTGRVLCRGILITGNAMTNIFNFIDYRHYLIALYDDLKAADSTVSYRSFARMAGSSSPNFLQLIRDRKLNISPRSLALLAKSLKLSRKEEEYLEAIVSFDHAKTHQEKDKFLKRLLQLRGGNCAVELQREQYDFVSHWYIPVVRELLICRDYPDDPKWIAERIVPQVTVTQVKKAIILLQALGLVERSAPGEPWKQTSRTVTTPSEVLSVAATNYHLTTIDLGREAIERFKATERDIRSVTIGLPQQNIAEIKNRIETFWSELLSYANEQDNVEQVVQINIQMFPMSDAGSSNEKSM